MGASALATRGPEEVTDLDGGGESGKLFIAKPHEIVRYARILKRLGKL